MCLIVFSWQLIGSYPFISASNRDEYYSRPSAPAAWWTDFPQIFAPRDLLAGGTWMGVAKLPGGGHQFAALTNVRDGSAALDRALSRGQLVADYLKSGAPAQSYIQQIKGGLERYNGFNLLLGEISPARQELYWLSNRYIDDPRNGQLLAPGIYGLSNGALDTPWPKVCKTKAELASLLCQNAPQEAYFEMLSNTFPAPDHRLPNTGVSLEFERLLSATCIQSENYGTRSSTLLKLNDQFGMEYDERTLR